MPGPPRSPTPPFGSFNRNGETDALWRARDEDRAEAKERFGKLESGVTELRQNVTDVKMSVNGILDNEERRTASAEKRNARIWHLFSAFLVALLVPLVIAIFKVFAPIAVTGVQGKPETVIEHLDQVQHTLGEGK